MPACHPAGSPAGQIPPAGLLFHFDRVDRSTLTKNLPDFARAGRGGEKPRRLALVLED